KTLTKKIKSAVTDSEREIRFDPVNKAGVSNLLTIQQALTDKSVERLVEDYEGRGYGDLKADTAEIVVDFIRPIRDVVGELMSDTAELQRLMAMGAHKARSTARHTLADVYDAIGFVTLPGE
ncbi:MAG: tryptophan--tRNA ligase, partial [Candidatus Nanopelagicales bacterium]